MCCPFRSSSSTALHWKRWREARGSWAGILHQFAGLGCAFLMAFPEGRPGQRGVMSPSYCMLTVLKRQGCNPPASQHCCNLVSAFGMRRQVYVAGLPGIRNTVDQKAPRVRFIFWSLGAWSLQEVLGTAVFFSQLAWAWLALAFE